MSNSILIVEDNLKLGSYLKKRLEVAGFKVNIERRGDKAVFSIINQKPELVILDIMLPGMSGNLVCNTVRDDYSGKILMLTAVNDVAMEVSTLNLGADDYLTKPVKEPVLLARINALLRRPTLTNKLTDITFGGLKIDLIMHQVTLFEIIIKLSPTEYALLSFLAKNADEILNRDNISYALKGREYDGLDRNIDLNISRLRKLLNDNPKKPYKIRTVFKRGYMLVSSSWCSL